MADIRKEQSTLASKNDVVELKQQIDDLENRSCMKNIVFWGVPEDNENKTSDDFVVHIIKNFIVNHMAINNRDAMEIDRAKFT